MTVTDAPPAQPKLRRIPPRVPRRATPGLFIRMARDRLGVMSAMSETYGDAVRMPMGPKTLYFFNRPEHAKQVLADNSANYHKGIGLKQARRALGDGLLTSEGELWRKQRRTIQPVFQAKRMALQAGAIAEEAAGLVARLKAHQGGEPVDIRHEMTELTLGVLGRTLLDADLGSFDNLGASFEAIQDQAMFEMMSLNMVPMWFPLPMQLRFRRARGHLQQVVDQLVARASGGGDDAVSRLVESTAQEADPAVGRRRMRDELVTLLLAGHETTASTLSWAFYLLDQHPGAWERVHAEAVEVLGDRQPEFADLKRLTFTSMVIDEVMRLYPPVWLLSRGALADDEVGGYHVPAGADVLVCPYTLHRHPDFWERPNRFDPDRFDPTATSGRPRYAYIPFGAGPRFCIGNHLGLMEAAFVLAMIARELRLTSVPGYRMVPEPMLTLRVRGSLPMRVRAA